MRHRSTPLSFRWITLLLFACLIVCSCQRALTVDPYFDGIRTGEYVYMSDVDGAPAEVTTSAVFEVTAKPSNKHKYEFEGTLEWLGDTYSVTGREELPDEIALRPQVTAFISRIRIVPVDSSGTQKYIMCGTYFYGTGGYIPDFSDNRGATLNVYPITAADVCFSSSADIVGTIYLPPGEW